MKVIFIGTSHIAKESVEEIRKTIYKEKPKIIVLEIDEKRYLALSKKGNQNFGIKKIGKRGFFFALIISYLQKKLGEKIGILPGSEMLEAINCGKKIGSKIFFIDQDIEKTLRKISEEVSWWEKFKFILDLLKMFFLFFIFLFKKPKKTFDLSKVPKKTLIRKLIKKFKKSYPSLYRILVEERNKFMVERIKELIKKYPDEKILVIVGAGHQEEMAKEINYCLSKE